MKEIKLTMIERKELERISRAQAVSVAQSRRARLILLLAEGAKWVSIREKLGCDTRFISRWRGRFIAERLAGLFSRHAGRASYKVDEGLEAKILAWTTKRKPADGSTHWSSRKLAGELGAVSHMTVARVWAKHRLRPHPLERCSAWMKKPRFRRGIVKTRCCRSPQAEPSVTALSTTVMARFRFLPLSTPARATSWAKPLSATLRRGSWPSSLTSGPSNPIVKRSTSSPIISPPTKPRRWRNSLLVIPTFICILPRRIPPGSIK